MTHKNKIVIGIVVSIVGFVLANILFEYTKIQETPILFLFAYSIAVFICFFILYFLPEQVYISWWKFSRIYIPASAIIVVITPASSGLMGFYSSDKERYIWLAGVLFFLISLILIIRKAVKLRRASRVSL